ncbi:hypothetical protein D9V84_03785 [Bacteroidetes/Chlorobi group bacterium Naka2016]|nr:MAG: hypothetical protein D9V84_03785 [Bacteroidetes/Chlorobi group bacterium Naka2016]
MVGLDSVGKVLWEKPNLSCWIVVNPYNKTTYVVSNSTIMEINGNGEVLRTYYEKKMLTYFALFSIRRGFILVLESFFRREKTYTSRVLCY